MTYLARRFRILPLAELVASLREGRPIPPRAMAITFDDGYRDNLTEAAPIMHALGIPATLFFATGPQEREEPFWWDTLELVGRSPEFRAAVKRASLGEFRRLVAQSLAELTPAAARGAIEQLYMNWDELRTWQRLGMDVGAHTATHPILAKLSPAEMAEEILPSRARLERELDRPITLFAYPNGKAADYSDHTRHLLAENGFTAACTTIEAMNDATTDLFSLRRFIARDESLPFFALRISRLMDAAQQTVLRSAG
jgi:peptidoglycan/xylan/chitin deacetylase (PgdA/CDA1 family)